MIKTRCILSICLFLVLISGLCCRKEPQQTTTDELIEPERTEYFALFLEGRKIGHAIQNRSVAQGNVTTTIELEITLSRTGIPITTQTRAVTIETTKGKPISFEIEQDMGLFATKTVGSVDPNGMATVMTGQQRSQFEWPKEAVMSEGMSLLHYQNGLKEGTQYTAKLFDPSIMQVVDVEVKVGKKQDVDLLGRVVALTEVISTTTVPGLGSLVSSEYYNDELILQKSITPLLGMTIEQVACTREFALGQDDVFEVVDRMFTASPEPLNDLGSVSSITYQLSVDSQDGEFILPPNDNQKIQDAGDGTILLTVEPVAAPAGVSFPYRGSEPVALEALEPTRYLQSKEQQIITLAHQAVGDTTDAAEAARRIEDFVSEYISNRSMSVGYATSMEVAQSRQGDCTEFAVLTAALCRAIGIPAQVVAGIAYVDDFAGLSGFGGHAWVQVYIGDRWVGLDSAFKGSGRGGYDAGHIALASGGGEPADFFSLVTTLGRFKIEQITIVRK